MQIIKSLGIYCGSSEPADNQFKSEIIKIGELLARHKIKLIYGGGESGLMGAVSNSVYKNGGEVEGFITEHLVNIEKVNKNIPSVKIVKTMHERKINLFNRSDAFLIFPGGIGTLEEFFEVLSWKQLNMHSKKIGIYNFKNYWCGLDKLIEHIIDYKFAGKNMKQAYKVIIDIKELSEFLDLNAKN